MAHRQGSSSMTIDDVVPHSRCCCAGCSTQIGAIAVAIATIVVSIATIVVSWIWQHQTWQLYLATILHLLLILTAATVFYGIKAKNVAPFFALILVMALTTVYCCYIVADLAAEGQKATRDCREELGTPKVRKCVLSRVPVEVLGWNAVLFWIYIWSLYVLVKAKFFIDHLLDKESPDRFKEDDYVVTVA